MKRRRLVRAHGQTLALNLDLRGTPMTSLIAVLYRTLGRCPRCMRKSFLAALGAWVLAFAAGATVGPATAVATACGAAALGLSGLWLAHVVAFASRMTAATARNLAGDARPGTPAGRARLRTRREIAVEFARTAAFVALATALSTKVALACVQPPKRCSANSDCTCSQCCGDLAGIQVCQPSC